VINENDVLSVPDRRKLFSDNDSLAVLVATELKSDVLMLGSDVPGIFRGPPEPGQPPDVLPVVTRSTPLSFGAKSARGRGGMQAKVEAALSALERGVSAVVIFSGFEPLGVLRILKGETLGTLLLTENEAKLEMAALATLKPPKRQPPRALPEPPDDPSALAAAVECREASRALQKLSFAERGTILHACADALEAGFDLIAKANGADVAAARASNMSAASTARLLLPLKKLQGVTAGLRAIASQPDPLWRIKRHVELAPGLVLKQETVPIGVILVIFESRPDVVPQVTSLSLS
jgi:delta-1-pyrroline-5-carboxylate synthetase